MSRRSFVQEISRRLGLRQLVWFGTRAEDAVSLSDIPQFSGAYSLIAPLSSRPSVTSTALEEATGYRPDLDTFNLDDHLRSPEVCNLRVTMLQALARPSALVTYRPTIFLAAVGFSRQDRCQFLGMFRGLQHAFEYKPWLETSIKDLGVPVIEWQYIPDQERLDTRRLFSDGSVMLRRSQTTGGVGLVKVDDPEDLVGLWPEEDEAFVSVARFIPGGIPLNISGVVWQEDVTVHRASVQLIGIPSCTSRVFGYCGNDFATCAQLDPEILDRAEESTRTVGHWLRRSGYFGAFGIDFLVVDGVPLFTEVNPRFQGSTHLTCQLSVERDEPCLMTEHIGAFLGLDSPARPTLRQQMADNVDLAHIVIHNTDDHPAYVDGSVCVEPFTALSSFERADILTSTTLETGVNGTIARVTFTGAVTDSGFELSAPYGALATSLQNELHQAPSLDSAR